MMTKQAPDSCHLPQLSSHSQGIRNDFQTILEWVSPNSRVLDLGCSDGALLETLQLNRHIQGYGVELDDHNILRCVERGVPVIQQNLEDGLALFQDQSFDWVILSETLQTIHRTQWIIREMARVGTNCVVSFPNFSYWYNRLMIARGMTPITKSLPHRWHDTPNVRIITIQDFEQFINCEGLSIVKKRIFNHGKFVRFLPNWLGTNAIYHFKSPVASANDQ